MLAPVVCRALLEGWPGTCLLNRICAHGAVTRVLCWNVAIPFHSKPSLTEEPLQDAGSRVRHSAGLGELQQPG